MALHNRVCNDSDVDVFLTAGGPLTTATPGEDFLWAIRADGTVAPVTITIPHGNSVATMPLTFPNDSDYELPSLIAIAIDGLTNGAAINTTSAEVLITVLDDGDVSPPAAPAPPTVVRSTGGLLELSLDNVDPVATGGANEFISQRTLWRLLDTGQAEESPLIVTGLQASTTYRFAASVWNSKFESAQSLARVVSTTRTTPPSAPLGVTLVHATGGLVQLSWSQPIDTGGEPVASYGVQVFAVDQAGGVRCLRGWLGVGCGIYPVCAVASQFILQSMEVQVNADDPQLTELSITTHNTKHLQPGQAVGVYVFAVNSEGQGDLSTPHVRCTVPAQYYRLLPPVTLLLITGLPHTAAIIAARSAWSQHWRYYIKRCAGHDHTTVRLGRSSCIELYRLHAACYRQRVCTGCELGVAACFGF